MTLPGPALYSIRICTERKLGDIRLYIIYDGVFLQKMILITLFYHYLKTLKILDKYLYVA